MDNIKLPQLNDLNNSRRIFGLPIEKGKIYLYLLLDPRNGKPHYVGVTSSPKKRYEHHRYGRKSILFIDWLNELQSLKLSYLMYLVEDVTDNSQVREYETIQQLKAEGHTLFNIAHNEVLPSKKIPNRLTVQQIEDYINDTASPETILALKQALQLDLDARKRCGRPKTSEFDRREQNRQNSAKHYAKKRLNK